MRHRLEVADVLRTYGDAYLEAYGKTTSAQQRRVLHDLVRCRTAALGGHVEQCDACGHQRIAYNSCRNRHCPRCQAVARAEWLDNRTAELLPVPHFHVVFTLPHDIGPVALQNPRTVYNLLFQATAETLLQIAGDPKHLGARIGFLAVLHTWGQTLQYHPHLHCVIPGGGLSYDGTQWIDCREDFFVPVRILGRVFRGKFLAMLKAAFDSGNLGFYGQQQHLAEPEAFHNLLEPLYQTNWMVYSQPPLGKRPQRVLKYLARYTHQVAIANRRLIKMEKGVVHFHWKDYAHGHQQKVMALDAVEFIRRFLLHVLPNRFVRIRYFGLFANRHRQKTLQHCRQVLNVSQDIEESSTTATGSEEPSTEQDEPTDRCPVCHKGRMVIIEIRRRPRIGEETKCGGWEPKTIDSS